MQKSIIIFWMFLALLTGHRLAAQCKDNRWDLLDVNKVAARFQNGPNKFWDMSGKPYYEVPRGSNNHVSFAGGLWVGGLDPQGQLHVSASTYRQTGWEWYVGPTRNQPLDCPIEIEASGDIMLHGMKRISNGDVLILTQWEVIIYDPVTETKLVRQLPVSRAWIDAIELPDGRIFLYGDWSYPTKNPVLFLDTLTYTLSGGPTLNWFHRESSVDLLDDGRLLIAGVVGCEIFDPQTNLSTAVPDMIWPRTQHATAHLPNGDIMAFGGGSGISGAGATAFTQYFDDTLGYWFPGPLMSVARNRAATTTFPDGKVLIVGGSGTDSTTQIYDPALDTLYAGTPLPRAILAPHVSVYDSTSLIVTERDGNESRIYRFNHQTGEYTQLRLQRNGGAHFLLNPNELLMQADGLKNLQKFDLQTHEQAQSRWQYVWKVDRSQIDAFRADFQNGQVDFNQYPQIASWPAHGDESLGEDRNLAPFVDVNGDGRYEPALDGDYPCILGDQALWWVYNDIGPHLESNGQQFGLQVEAMAYAFDCSQSACPDTSLDYTTFFHYELTNQSIVPYHDIYLGEHMDYDLGAYSDDYYASDSSLRLAIAYNGTDNDLYYGAHPPAWGSTILNNGQVDMGAAFNVGTLSGSYDGPPSTPAEYYYSLQGLFIDGQSRVNNGLNGYAGTAPGPPTRYMYPSTDGFCGGPLSGWSEISAGNSPFDRRFVTTTTAFDLPVGEKIQWDLAYIYARDSSNLASVCALKSATATIRDWWQNQLDRACFSTVVGTEAPKPESALQIVPNPVGGTSFTVNFGAPLEDDGQLQLIDLQGRVLQGHGVSRGTQTDVVDVTQLSAGVYLLRMVQPSGVRMQRVVVW